MKIPKRRRLEAKTNYSKRLKLLKGRYTRLVVRKTNKYVTLQIVESKNAQDRVSYSASTRELLEFGWPKEKKGSLKSLSAVYLAGLLLAKKAKNFKNKLILDSGLIPSTKGSRIYAAVKGVLDGGLEIIHNKKVFPTDERIEGKANNLEVIFKKVKEKMAKENGKK